MSGIIALLSLDGRPLSRALAIGQLDAIADRGDRRRRTWLDERVALGHVNLPATPEAEREKLPASDRSSRFWLTWDGRPVGPLGHRDAGAHNVRDIDATREGKDTRVAVALPVGARMLPRHRRCRFYQAQKFAAPRTPDTAGRSTTPLAGAGRSGRSGPDAAEQATEKNATRPTNLAAHRLRPSDTTGGRSSGPEGPVQIGEPERSARAGRTVRPPTLDPLRAGCGVSPEPLT